MLVTLRQKSIRYGAKLWSEAEEGGYDSSIHAGI